MSKCCVITTACNKREVADKIIKSLLEKRLVALYEAGETTYLDMLLASDDLSDFISNYYSISKTGTCIPCFILFYGALE